MVTVERITVGGFSGARRCVRCAEGMRGEYIVRCRSVLSLMRSRLDASGVMVNAFERAGTSQRGLIHVPKKPKSPVWMIAHAFASRARSFNAERRPRMSAMHSRRPWAVSKTFVWVLTWCGTEGWGDAAGLVEVLAGREGCIFDEVQEQSARPRSDRGQQPTTG